MKINRPTLIIDEVKARKNIAFMAGKAKKSNLLFRPHFKTHQSATVARWFREMGVNHIAVSSLAMAHYFYQHGWDDIHIAFPYNLLEHQELYELAKHIKLTVSIESQQALTHLKFHMKTPIHYMIETDVGYGRTGIDARNWESILSLADQGNSICQFSGLMAHAGHTYDAHGTDEIEKAHPDEKDQSKPLAKYADIKRLEGPGPWALRQDRFREPLRGRQRIQQSQTCWREL